MERIRKRISRRAHVPKPDENRIESVPTVILGRMYLSDAQVLWGRAASVDIDILLAESKIKKRALLYTRAKKKDRQNIKEVDACYHAVMKCQPFCWTRTSASVTRCAVVKGKYYFVLRMKFRE